MTFEARDSAAKVTPARPQAMPRPVPRRGPPCAAPARLDQLGGLYNSILLIQGFLIAIKAISLLITSQ